jgi:hypothetical protein
MARFLIRTIKFNPYHDPLSGKFTSANRDLSDPSELMGYMKLLATHEGYHPNIMNMKVAGHAIFHPDKSLGLSREQMPQIPTAARADFLNSLPTQLVDLDPRNLKPTQTEIDGFKTAKFMMQEAEGTDRFRPPIVSRDHYVIDGHHNWASRVVQAVANPGKNVMMPAYLVDMNRDQLLTRARAYADAKGFEAKPIHKFNPNHLPAGTPTGGQFCTANAPGSHPIQWVDMTELFKTLPKPKFKPLSEAVVHDLQQWVDVPLDFSDSWEPAKYRVKVKFNPNHVPAGTPEGGEFAPGDEMAEFNSAFGPFMLTNYPTSSGNARTYAENQAAHDLHPKLYAQSEKWLKDQPPKVREDLAKYVGADYGPLNAYLRTGKAEYYGMVMNQGEAKSMAARLERALDDAPVLPDGTQLYRAFRSDEVVARAESESGYLEGGTFQDRAFLSTTTNPKVMGDFYEDKDNKSNAVLLRMTTRDGARGVYTAAALPPQFSTSKGPAEYEVLINRSTPIYVNKITRLSTGAVVLDADIYGPPARVGRFNPNHAPAGSPEGGQFAPYRSRVSIRSVSLSAQGYLDTVMTPRSASTTCCLGPKICGLQSWFADGEIEGQFPTIEITGTVPLNSYLRGGMGDVYGSSDLVPLV